MTKHVKLGGKSIQAKVRDLSREPFQDILSSILKCKPDEKSLKEFAKAHPDRWAQAAAIFARNSGYTDKTVVEHNFFHYILNLSDAELLHLSQNYDKVIEGEVLSMSGESNDKTNAGTPLRTSENNDMPRLPQRTEPDP